VSGFNEYSCPEHWIGNVIKHTCNLSYPIINLHLIPWESTLDGNSWFPCQQINGIISNFSNLYVDRFVTEVNMHWFFFNIEPITFS